jgi:hypothetical protein
VPERCGTAVLFQPDLPVLQSTAMLMGEPLSPSREDVRCVRSGLTSVFLAPTSIYVHSSVSFLVLALVLPLGAAVAVCTVNRERRRAASVRDLMLLIVIVEKTKFWLEAYWTANKRKLHL